MTRMNRAQVQRPQICMRIIQQVVPQLLHAKFIVQTPNLVMNISGRHELRRKANNLLHTTSQHILQLGEFLLEGNEFLPMNFYDTTELKVLLASLSSLLVTAN